MFKDIHSLIPNCLNYCVHYSDVATAEMGEAGKPTFPNTRQSRQFAEFKCLISPKLIHIKHMLI